MKTIIVDMMGGDRSPAETVRGVALAATELDAAYILVGDRELLEKEAENAGVSLDGFEIVHTPTVITMEDEPACVMRAKADSSMSVGLKLLAEGRGDAFVSTGNTGALFTGANLIVRRIPGLRRPAIAALLPMNPPLLLLDSGANVSVTPDYLEEFALMGAAYMKKLHGLENPRVGLLNNGAESHKGTPLQVEAYRLLSDNPAIHFVGNVEGNRVMADACDVLVTDGFTGNILLKTAEGMGGMMLSTMKKLFLANLKTKLGALCVKSELSGVKKQFDTREFGGAPILGIAKPIIKAHGNSDAKAFKNAIRQALAAAESSLTDEIASSMEGLLVHRRQRAEKGEGDSRAE